MTLVSILDWFTVQGYNKIIIILTLLLLLWVVGEDEGGGDHVGGQCEGLRHQLGPLAVLVGRDVDLWEDGAQVEVDEGPGLGVVREGRKWNHLGGGEGTALKI